MRKLLYLGIAGGVFICSAANGQQLKSQLAGQPGMFPSDMQFDVKTAPTFQRGVVPVPDAKGALTNLPGLKLTHSEMDALGAEHIRYQQSFQGIPIEHAVLVQHVEKNKVVHQNGKLIRDFLPQLSATATLSESAALALALSSINAQKYKWQIAGEEAFIKVEQNDASATFFPKGQLVFYSGEEEVIPAALHLAYKFDIYAQEPMSRQIIFVDAKNGTILGRRELIHEANAIGTATTAYSGSQTITADAVSASSYRLRETGRGSGIQTFNLKKGTNYNSATDFTDTDNNWNNANATKDQYATDAHWGAEKTYDYYFQKYGRNSINNGGFLIKSYVHYSTNYFNAFWDGSRMTYGDGDAAHGSLPLTALDVCGHEITHGVTSYSSNLTYSGESGAMNEGFSDIFGTAIEFYARPDNANWLIGSDFYTLRSMSNPNQYLDPDTYQGTYWYTGTADNGGVHTNSGVLNYWFYLLTTGGSGTNDKGTIFDVTGLGVDKAGAIAYRTNTFYLVSTSKYADARTYSIKAAEDLYGIGSAEAIQTANAWTAVGVGAIVIQPGCTDIYESNESRTAAKTIAVNTDITAKIGSSSDKDWFKITTTAAAPKVQIALTSLPADYDLRFYNNSGMQLGISQVRGTTNETIKYNSATKAGTYYVQVYGYNGANNSSCYTLRASTSSTKFIEGIDADEDENGLLGKPITSMNTLLKMQPVPAINYSTLSFGSLIRGKAEIIVTNVAGAVVLRTSFPVISGSNQYRLDVSGLKTGMYVVKLANGDETQVQKLIVQH